MKKNNSISCFFIYFEYIVLKNEDRIITQKAYSENGKLKWNNTVDVYYKTNPPNENVKPKILNLPDIPEYYEPVEGINEIEYDENYFASIKAKLGDNGLIGTWLTNSCVLASEEDVYRYYDNPEYYRNLSEKRIEDVEKRFSNIMKMKDKPDFLCVGGSGTLVLQSVKIFREVALPAVKRAIELSKKAGIPTHIYSCGPEKALVKIMAEETDLTVIDPLEIPPMGDCSLKELKNRYGKKLVLKGNIHTTDVMLLGSVEDVKAACRNAIDDAASGGKFILSTGDQCGRDTPYENIFAMVETARTYGRY